MNKIHSNVDLAIGSKIRMLRISRRFTKEELSGEIGMSVDEYDACEDGKARLTPKTLYKLCQVLGTTSKEIFSDISMYRN